MSADMELRIRKEAAEQAKQDAVKAVVATGKHEYPVRRDFSTTVTGLS